MSQHDPKASQQASGVTIALEAGDAPALWAAVANTSVSSVVLTGDIFLAPAPTGARALLPDVRNRSLAVSGAGCLPTLGRPCELAAAPDARSRLLLVAAGGRLTIANITLVGGAAGDSGAIAKVEAGGALTCLGATLRGTLASDSGGLLHVSAAGSTLTAVDCLLENGRAAQGGALHLSLGASASLWGGSLRANEATSSGGAVILDGPGTQLRCESTLFVGNKVVGNGGAVVLTPGTVASIIGVTFEGNQAGRSAGAIHVYGAGAAALLSGVRWMGNRAGEHGAALVATLGANVTVDGGYAVDNVALGLGGAVMARDLGTLVTVARSRVEGSRADWGGALYLQSGARVDLVDSDLVNSTAGSAGGAVSAVGAATRLTLLRVNLVASRSLIVGGTLLALAGVDMILEDVTMTGARSQSHGACTHFNGATFVARNVTAHGNQAATIGGCFYFTVAGTVHLTDVTITNNVATQVGGGLLAESCGKVTLSGVRLQHNTAGQAGGAIRLANNGAVTIADMFVSDSFAPNGGALHISGGDLDLRRCTFLRNRAGSYGGFLEVMGGARVALIDSEVRQHEAAVGGGCVHVTGNSTRLLVGAGTSLHECSAQDGAAVLISSGASATVEEGAALVNNTAARWGGAIGVRGSGSTLKLQGRVQVLDNAAHGTAGCGGALALLGGAAALVSGGVHLAGNGAAYGGAFCVQGDGTALTMEAGASAASLSSPGEDLSVDADASAWTVPVVENNVAALDGGAVFLVAGASASLVGRFWNNAAGRDGGGVWAGQQPGREVVGTDGSSAAAPWFSMEGGDLRQNEAQGDGGAVFLNGGAHAALSACSLQHNAAGGNGGGVYVGGEGTALTVASTNVTDQHAQGNGGALSLALGVRVLLSDVQLLNNRASAHAGGIFADGGQLLASGCSLCGNAADLTGGALFLTGNRTHAWLQHAALAANAALHGGGAYVQGGALLLAEDTAWDDNLARSGWGGALVVLGPGSAFGCNGCSLAVDGQPLALASPGKQLVSKDASTCVVSPLPVGAPLVPFDSFMTGGEGGGGALTQVGVRLALLTDMWQQMADLGGGVSDVNGNSTAALRVYGCSDIPGIDVEVPDFATLETAVADLFVGRLHLTLDLVFGGPVVVNRPLEIVGACHLAPWAANSSDSTFTGCGIPRADGNKGAVLGATARLQAGQGGLPCCHVSPLSVSAPLFLVGAGGRLLLQDMWLVGQDEDSTGTSSSGNSKEGSSSNNGGASNHSRSYGMDKSDSDSISGAGLVHVGEGGAFVANGVTFAGITAATCAAVNLVGSCNASFTGCAFVANQAAIQGGVICARAGAEVTVSGSMADENMAGLGGFLYASGNGTVVTLLDALLTNNSAGNGGGGAVFLAWGARMIARGSVFSSNSAVGSNGGAAHVGGEGTYMSVEGGCTLEANAAQLGGAIYIGAGASLAVSGAAFASNYAAEGGGAVAVVGPAAHGTVTNASFAYNQAGARGGALSLLLGGGCQIGPRVAVVRNRANDSGGGADVTDAGSHLSCSGCTFNDNVAGMRGGALCASRGAAASVTNSNVSRNSAGKLGGSFYAANSGTFLNITTTRVEGGRAETAGGGLYLISAAKAGIQGGHFLEGAALFGGGMVLEGAGTSVLVTGTLFERHLADRLGGVAFLTAGALATFVRAAYAGNRVGERGRGGVGFAQNVGTAVFSHRCQHKGNTAGSAGGAWFLLGGASMASEGDAFDSNSAGQGGAVYALEYATHFGANGSTFTNNSVDGDGGALYFSSVSYATLQGCHLARNRAGSHGGAIYWGDASSGGISRRNVYEGNEARAGGAIALVEGGELQESSGDVFQDNFAEVHGGAVLVAGSVAHFAPGTLQGGATPGWDGAPVSTDPGCIFQRNRAPRGGALYVDCTLGPTSSTSVTSPSTSGADPDPSAATACVSLDQCGFRSNTAVGGCGGALWSASRNSLAVTCADASPARGSVSNTSSSSNTSDSNTGSFSNNADAGNRSSSTTIATSNANDSRSSSNATTPSQWCPDWAFNVACEGGYGPQACTPGTSLVVMPFVTTNSSANAASGASTGQGSADGLWPGLTSGTVPTMVPGASLPRISAHRSGAELRNMVVVLVDEYEQVVTTETGLLLSAAILTASAQSPGAAAEGGEAENPPPPSPPVTDGEEGAQPSGNVSQPRLLGRLVSSFVNGVAVMEGIHLTAREGTYRVGFASGGLSSRARVDVSTRTCLQGEVNVSDACEPCAAPLFSWDPTNASCDACPPNAACYGGHVVVPLAGYWQPSATSYGMHACPRYGACAFRRRAEEIAEGKRAGGSWDPDVQCSPGYRGMLCAQCMPGYGRSTGYRCDRCPPRHVAVPVYILLALISTAVIAYIVHSALRMSQGGESVEDYMLGTLAKIFVSWLQILGMLSQVSSTRLRGAFEYVAIISDVFSGPGDQAVSLDCLLSGMAGDDKQLFISGIYILLPIGGLLLAATFWALYFLYLRARGQQGAHTWTSFFTPRAIVSGVAILFALWPRVVFRIFKLFACRRGPSVLPGTPYYVRELASHPASGLYWELDLEQRCFAGTHLTTVLAFGVVGLALFCVVAPVYFVVYLRYLRKHKANASTGSWNEFRSFCFLYLGYKPRFWWMEVALLAQKMAFLLMIVVLGVVRSSVELQLFFFLVMLTLFAAMHARLQPYAHVSLNRIQGHAWGSLILLNVVLLFFYLAGPMPLTCEKVLEILISTLYMLLIAGMLALTVRYGRQKIKDKARGLLISLSSRGILGSHRSSSLQTGSWRTFSGLKAYNVTTTAGAALGTNQFSTLADTGLGTISSSQTMDSSPLGASEGEGAGISPPDSGR